MAINKYCNLYGENKIKDDYTKINDGFAEVETDVNGVLNSELERETAETQREVNEVARQLRYSNTKHYGPYDPDFVYHTNNIVSKDGCSFMLKENSDGTILESQGFAPPTYPTEENERWKMVGKRGEKGDTGVVPNVQVGIVTTLQPGNPVIVTRQSGSPDEAPVFDFGIPRGADGTGVGDVLWADIDQDHDGVIDIANTANTAADANKLGGQLPNYYTKKSDFDNLTDSFNTHLSETATNAHRASNISITDAEGRFTATNVESALNELFTSANDGKTAVATAITAKGVDASPTDTFPILATKIGQITTGKRVITTTLTVASTQKNFYIQNVSTAQASWYVIYNGSIPFEPSRIVLSNRGTLSPTADPNYPLWVVYDKNGVTDAAGPDYIKILTVYLSSNGFGTWASSGQVFRLEGEAYVNGLGFCLPLRASSSTPSFAGKIMDCTIYE